MILRPLLAATLAVALAAAPALAVERKPVAAPKKPAVVEKPAPEPEPPPQQPSDGSPPYEAQLTRLSEIMGALAWLRSVCGDSDSAEYRARMAALLDAEATAPERRERLAGAYNRGYHGYETTYRACTPNARMAIARFLDEGGKIAHEISYRFGGS